MISVFLTTVSHAVQGLAANLVLSLAFYLQSVCQPFTLGKLNKLEQMSILTAATTIYCGLLYMTDEIGDDMKILLFAMILLANTVFIVCWIYSLIEAYAVLITEKCPKLAKLCCICFVKSKNFRRMSTTLGIDVQRLQAFVDAEPDDSSSCMSPISPLSSVSYNVNGSVDAS